MRLPNQVHAGQKGISAAEWNRIVKQVDRLSSIFASPPLEMGNGGNPALRFLDPVITGKLTSTGWVEVQPNGDGTWSVPTNGRSGNLVTNEAIEVNGQSVPSDLIVRLYPGLNGEYLYWAPSGIAIVKAGGSAGISIVSHPAYYGTLEGWVVSTGLVDEPGTIYLIDANNYAYTTNHYYFALAVGNYFDTRPNDQRTGATTSGSTTVTVPSTTGLFTGQPFTGTGIATNTTVSSITDGTHFVMSNAATSTQTATVLLFYLLGNTTNGSPVITGINSTSNLKVGQTVSGSGIPANTTIVSIDSGTQVTLSNNATATASNVTLNFQRGNVPLYITANEGTCKTKTIVTDVQCISGVLTVTTDTLTYIDCT